MTTQEHVKHIKQSFHLLMDGKTAQSMRDKGLQYKLNWGASLPMLRQQAGELRAEVAADGGDSTSRLYDLAIALWKEDVRECKILATMLMPADRLLPEVADIWLEQVPSQEMAEQVAFNLFQHLSYAPQKAFQWIASPRAYDQLCGFHMLTRLFMNGQEPNERGINEFLDQSLCALQGSSMAVRKAAMQSVQRFSELGVVYERLAKSALKSINLELL